MEIITSVIGKVVELTVEPIRRQLNYLCFIADNIQKLKKDIEMLKETKENVERMVYDARRNVEDIKPSVQNWLMKVDAIIERSEIITNEAQQVSLCLNLVQRHQLSRKAVKMADEVLEMKNEGNFDRVSYSVPKFESLSTKNSDFLNFDSRSSTKEQIMDALVADNVNKIGIYGMGGVGKTMIVKEISREVNEKKLFNEVVQLTISQTPDLKGIQGELAEKLGLKLEENTIKGRALKLNKRLMMEKRYLIVFDDIWAPIDLEMIGIPSDVDHKGCKILFTSRDKHTLSNDNCIDKIFEIKVLREDEAWNLFKKIVGETIETLDFKPLALEIVKECGNLPIAVITVAKALRYKTISVWIDTLNQLRNPKAMNIRGMNDKVYASLKLSYEQLEHEAKMLILLCSMFPEDFKIDTQLLHIYAMAFDFLYGVDTMTKRRHRITKLIDDLLSSSLLQICEDDNEHIKMHDLVRDVAISIASENDQIRTLSYVKNSNQWEADELLSNHTAVYLDFADYQNSPKKLMFPKAKLLVLVGRRISPGELSTNFIEEMKELKVLVLESMKLSLLRPQFLHSLTDVRSLHLNCCELENIDMIGHLNKLQVLSFNGSNITMIPLAISQLTELKVLDLSNCYELEVIPSNVLSKLTKLEELNLETYNGWEMEELNKETKNASISELMNLRDLYSLCLCIENEKVMPRHMFPSEFKLEKFNISIGSPQIRSNRTNENIRKKLYLKMESECCMNEWIKTLLKRSEILHLEGSFGSNAFLLGFDVNESSHVKHLFLLNICGLQHIFHSQKQPLQKTLSNLVHLYVETLNSLMCIVHGYDKISSFNKLKFVEVKECKKLEGLFVNCSMDNLLNIEEITITNCEMMEVILMMENKEATNKFEFTHLKTLHLYCLPRLKNFSSKMEKGRTSNINNNDPLFNEEVSLPNLEELKIQEADGLKMICGNIRFPNSFSKLVNIYIDSCKNLQKVFTWRIMSILTRLNSMIIKNCNLLEEIFEAQESNVTKERAFLLPSLKELVLSHLPKLRYVWSNEPSELLAFENMESLSIYQCPKLKKECVINVLPQLKYLKTDLNKLEAIFGVERLTKTSSELHQLSTSKVESLQSQNEPEQFSKLKTLKIHDYLDYNRTQFSMEILHLFPHLENLRVENALIKDILFTKEILIPKHLRDLTLYKLPRLKSLSKQVSRSNASIVFLQQLEFLSVEECGILNMLVPPSVSFRNLKDLSISQCNRLTYLLNPSVAKTLVQLQRLWIQGCKRMNTLIDRVGEVEQGNDEIVFTKLQDILLCKLPRLTSFHSGKCIIKFPCLSSVGILNCPEMKIFSLENVSTPRLCPESIEIYRNGAYYYPLEYKGMIVEDINLLIESNWEQNIDSNIQYLFAQDQNLEENQDDHSTSAGQEIV